MASSSAMQVAQIHREAQILFEKKNKDYGDSWREYGLIGVLMRMGDKLRRAQQIGETQVAVVPDEKLRDTLIDLCNYAAMAVALMDEIEMEAQEEGAED